MRRSSYAFALVAFLAACGGGGDASDTSAALGDTTPAAGAAAAGTPDADMQRVLDAHAALNPKPIPTLTPAEARQQPTPADAVKQVLQAQGKPTTPDTSVATQDRTIPGAAGQIPARIYTPRGVTGRMPVVVYYHGGGWVIGNKDVYDGGARGIAKMAQAVVVSVDYRLGPEHKFPAAHDDAFAAYQWVRANAASIGGDPARVHVAGESAGGNLAVATAMTARDRNVPLPASILSVYPIASGDTTSASYQQYADAKPLNRAMMSWFFQQYTRSAADRQDPRINLVGANLAGLPRTMIIAAEIDPLRTEGEQLAERMRTAGVNVTHRKWDGVTHEFFGMAAVHPKAMDAQTVAGQAIQGQ